MKQVSIAKIITLTIIEITEKLSNSPCKALQLTKKKGALTTTWIIYKRKMYYYYFDICERFVFDKCHRYSFNELIHEFTGSNYEIDEDVY